MYCYCNCYFPSLCDWTLLVGWQEGHPAHKSLCHFTYLQIIFLLNMAEVYRITWYTKKWLWKWRLLFFFVPVIVVKRLQIYSNIFVILVIGGELSDQTSCCWCVALFRRGSRAFPPVTAITYRDTPPRSLSRDRPTSRQNSLSRGRQSSLTRSRDVVNRSSNSGSAMQHGPQSHSVARDTAI